MSFDINPPSKNLSNVQASAKSCAGGGGNTGYFRRDGESEEARKKYDEEIFDTFEKGDVVLDDEQEESLLTKFLRFIEKLVDYIKSRFSSKVE